MKPFFDKGQFKTLDPPQTTEPRTIPSKSGYGVEIRNGRDIKKRKNSLFISSGRWAEMQTDGLIDQEIPPAVLGQNIDPLDFSPFSDANENKTPAEVLEDGEIIQGKTIDFESETYKDGRITIFDLRSRGYISNEEIPVKTRGIKLENETILGFSTGVSFNPFFDGGGSSLGILKEGFYGEKAKVTQIFNDDTIVNGLGYVIDDGDYNDEIVVGSLGFDLYSSKKGTDSIAFLGLLK